jgi:hypothetical protein
VPQNKDISDNWPQWFEGLSTTMNSYSSSCNGELIVAERVTASDIDAITMYLKSLQ